MWVLEAEGDVLQGKNRPYPLRWQQADLPGKRVWLRPGKKFLLAELRLMVHVSFMHANPANCRRRAIRISDKMVSRRHLTVEVDEVKPGECVRNPENKTSR